MIRQKEMLCPVGTVVALQDVDELYLIIGYFRTISGGETFDYSAVQFPYGDTGPESYMLFDQDQISRIAHKGFCDVDFQLLADNIAEVETEVHSRIKAAIIQAERQKKKTDFRLE